SDRELVVFPSPNLTTLENLEISLNDESQRWCKKHDRWTLQNVKNKPSTFFERQVANNVRKKEGQSLISYIGEVNQLADTLAAVGQTLHDKEVIRVILDHRLSLADCTLVMSIISGNDDITLNDLYADLVRLSQSGETSGNLTTHTNNHETHWSGYRSKSDVSLMSLVSDIDLTEADLDSHNESDGDGMCQSENELQDLSSPPYSPTVLHH
ncbi:unnamed protein product, partial [Urochloa humidicola]